MSAVSSAGSAARGRATGYLAILLAPLLMSLAACAPVATAPVAAPESGIEGVPARFLDQGIDWLDCEDGMQCSTVTVPLDWDHPDDGRTIELAVTRRPAAGAKIGSLFMNPGGPGDSGYDAVRDDWASNFSARLAERFDLVGWDPRGVGRSSPVTCYTEPADVERHLYRVTEPDWRVDEDGWVAANERAGRDHAAACARETGEALEFVDTESTVRDLDLLRALVGDERLNFLGFSYGTVVGQRYLDRFPDRVGRMVLDAAVDPGLERFDFDLQQEAGFELALARFVEACPERFGEACFLPSGTEAGLAAIRALVLAVDEHPIPASDPADGRTLSGATLRVAITQSLYSEAQWMELLLLLTEIGADPAVTDTAFVLADRYNDFVRGEGFTSNASDAYVAINCLDHVPVLDPALLAEQARRFDEVAPTLAVDAPPIPDTACANWPYPPRPSGVREIRGQGAPPILVVSTTGDPATPHVWGVRVAERLESAVLVTNHGDGHTAYRAEGAESACIRDTVDDYFIVGTVPRSDPHCGR